MWQPSVYLNVWFCCLFFPLFCWGGLFRGGLSNRGLLCSGGLFHNQMLSGGLFIHSGHCGSALWELDLLSGERRYGLALLRGIVAFDILGTFSGRSSDKDTTPGVEFHISIAGVVDQSGVHQLQIGFWKPPTTHPGPQDHLGVLTDVVLPVQVLGNLSPVDSITFKT